MERVSEELLNKIHKVKKAVGKISKDSENQFFKSSYTDINSLIDQLEPLFEKEGLMLLQPIEGDKVVSEIIDLKTGDKIRSSIILPDIADPQKIGSAVTYYRRYTLTSLLALQSEDDDGNVASGKAKPKKMVTMKQGKLLQSLGMEADDIRKLTSLEASDKIDELMK